MTVMVPTRFGELYCRRVRLARVPAAAAEARSQVRAAISDWDVPVDTSVAVLLTSELVTNAIRHEPGDTITLVITCLRNCLRVDVHDTSSSMPVLVDVPSHAQAGRGLMLVAALSLWCGVYRTPAGKAVYFTLASQHDLAHGGLDGPQGAQTWGL
jgi:anti-sigma regulatory factor (Ser/Thr protein kinase)